jgi:hypothetical protein
VSGWAPAGPERFRLTEGPASPAVGESSLQSIAAPSEAAAAAGRFTADNPLVCVAVLGALTFGLMAFSTSGTVRVGKTKLSGSLGVGS